MLLPSAILQGCAGPITPIYKAPPSLLALEQEKQLSLAFSQRLEHQQRVSRISYPLLQAGALFCGEQTKASLGISFSNKQGIEEKYRDTAIRDLGLGDALQILRVTPESPAAAAGLKPGDVLVSINGEFFKTGKQASKSVTALLRPLKAGTPINLVVARQGQSLSLQVTPVEICDFPILISHQDEVNAWANGNQISLTTGLLRFCGDDHDLALVIAHELAHNALRHVPKITRNALSGSLIDLLALGFGVPSPALFTIAGAHIHRSQFEAEADYFGLYILALSHLPLEGSANFWRRVAAEYPEQIDDSLGSTHPSSPQRFLALEAAITEIKTKQHNQSPLTPEGFVHPASKP
ncbi:MAG: M48 family metallopeptidase [Motiliproteus sp.]